MGINMNGQDFGGSLDDIINMAREFGDRIKERAPDMGPLFDSWKGMGRDINRGSGCCDNMGVYFYPPVNTYTDSDGSLVLEFALAGFDEKAVSVTFQGDYLVLNAKMESRDDDARFSMRGFRPRNIDRQKYSVSAEDYAQEQAKAVFKNGVLTVTVPVKERDGIKIEIVKEGN